MKRNLFARPLWRDPLLWLWVVAFPAAFQATYAWEERVGNGVDSGGQWAMEIGGVWIAVSVVVVAIAVVRRYLTRPD